MTKEKTRDPIIVEFEKLIQNGKFIPLKLYYESNKEQIKKYYNLSHAEAEETHKDPVTLAVESGNQTIVEFLAKRFRKVTKKGTKKLSGEEETKLLDEALKTLVNGKGYKKYKEKYDKLEQLKNDVSSIKAEIQTDSAEVDTHKANLQSYIDKRANATIELSKLHSRYPDYFQQAEDHIKQESQRPETLHKEFIDIIEELTQDIPDSFETLETTKIQASLDRYLQFINYTHREGNPYNLLPLVSPFDKKLVALLNHKTAYLQESKDIQDAIDKAKAADPFNTSLLDSLDRQLADKKSQYDSDYKEKHDKFLSSKDQVINALRDNLQTELENLEHQVYSPEYLTWKRDVSEYETKIKEIQTELQAVKDKISGKKTKLEEKQKEAIKDTKESEKYSKFADMAKSIIEHGADTSKLAAGLVSSEHETLNPGTYDEQKHQKDDQYHKDRQEARKAFKKQRIDKIDGNITASRDKYDAEMGKNTDEAIEDGNTKDNKDTKLRTKSLYLVGAVGALIVILFAIAGIMEIFDPGSFMPEGVSDPNSSTAADPKSATEQSKGAMTKWHFQTATVIGILGGTGISMYYFGSRAVNSYNSIQEEKLNGKKEISAAWKFIVEVSNNLGIKLGEKEKKSIKHCLDDGGIEQNSSKIAKLMVEKLHLDNDVNKNTLKNNIANILIGDDQRSNIESAKKILTKHYLAKENEQNKPFNQKNKNWAFTCLGNSQSSNGRSIQ